MKDIKFYLILHPDTFLWMGENEGVLYNGKEHSMFRFKLTDLIQTFCIRLKDLQNMYVIPINESDWSNYELKEWIEKIISFRIGKTIDYHDCKITPISFPPLLNLQSDIERVEAAQNRSIGEYAGQNWNEFSIYLGGNSRYPDLYKQTSYPLNSNSILDVKDLQIFFSSADNSCLNTINVIGDIFNYPYKLILKDLLNNIPAKINLYMTTSCIYQNVAELKLLNIQNKELFIFYEDKVTGDFIHNFLTEASIPFHWIYLISSEDQYEELEDLENKYGKDKIRIQLLYTGENIKFFEDNVYIKEEEFTYTPYDKQDVFAHQVMNTNFWGRLAVLPDGKVYSNLNQPSIGTLKDPVYELIVNEMKSKRSWRWTRDDMSPCKDCLYRYLCPSPSNYESVIGKPNLCHVKP